MISNSRLAFTEIAHASSPAFATNSMLVCQLCQGRIQKGDPVLHGSVTHADRRQVGNRRRTVHADCASDLRERNFVEFEREKSRRIP